MYFIEITYGENSRRVRTDYSCYNTVAKRVVSQKPKRNKLKIFLTKTGVK